MATRTTDHPAAPVRAQVADSWVRSAAAGVLAETVEAPVTLGDHDLRDYREAHPLAAVFPLLDDVLGESARECDAVMAVSDAAGQLLWVCGTPTVLRRAERIGFVEGSNWDERMAGTNAPGMALALDEPVQVVGHEHFRRSVQPWSCAATPIHDPATSGILGVLDITGSGDIVVPQTMGMVRAAARMAEAELARQSLARSGDQPGWPHGPGAVRSGVSLVLEALGRENGLLTIDDGRGRRRTVRLTRRHSEILVLLACAPAGLSGDELAVLLYEEDSTASTLRAEMNRLRGWLGDDLLASRPYRLVAELTADWLAVDAQIAAGGVRAAMRAYRGPLLPHSTAPGVEQLRSSVHACLRQALLRGAEPDLISTWTRSAWGRDDYEMWQAQLAALDARSPLRPLVVGQLTRLDRELGA